MEEAKGTQLSEVWDELGISAKADIVEGLVTIEKKLLSVSFNRSVDPMSKRPASAYFPVSYGNLYSANDTFEGCEKAEIQGEVPDQLRTDVSSRFLIGPVAERDFWNQERASMAIDRGPCMLSYSSTIVVSFRLSDCAIGHSSQEYITAIARRELAWLARYAVPKTGRDLFNTSKAQNDPNAHIALYNKFLAIAGLIVPHSHGLAKPTLWHWDLHASNIFIDSSNKITSIIDWQDIWIGPLFLQVRHPRLINYNGEFLLKLPEHYENLEDKEEKERLETQVERSVLLHTYESITAEKNPVLRDVLYMPHGPTRRQTVHFSANTWDNDIVPFRQCLIRMER